MRRQTPPHLTDHNCNNMRLPTHWGLSREFEKDERELEVPVDGQLVFNTVRPQLESGINRLGLDYMAEDIVASHIVLSVLLLHKLYYPDGRHASPALSSLVDALR